MKALSVFDRISVLDRTNFYAPGELGKTRSLTPEGFLVCEGVAIARTGEQRYHQSELPLDADGTGEITVMRTPEEVFSEQTIQSFNGKPVTMEHPNEFVTPESWKEHAIGTVQNVRRGSGIEDDMLIADLLITDAKAIEYVNKQKPELSCGYDSEYDQTEAGHAVQRNIVGNHVALVDRGRAGPRCAIKDHSPEETFMPKPKSTFARSIARVLTAFQSKDAEAMEKAIKDADEEEMENENEDGDWGLGTTRPRSQDKRIKDALDWIDARRAKDAEEEEAKKKEMADAELEKEEEKKKEAADKKAKDALLTAEAAPPAPDLGVLKTGDSADALKIVFARAEILSPGIAVPTGDSLKAKDALSALMLKAVKAAYTTDGGKACIDPFLLGASIEAVTLDNVSGVFTGGAELMRARNNNAASPGKLKVSDFGHAITPQSLNETNRKFWASRGG